MVWSDVARCVSIDRAGNVLLSLNHRTTSFNKKWGRLFHSLSTLGPLQGGVVREDHRFLGFVRGSEATRVHPEDMLATIIDTLLGGAAAGAGGRGEMRLHWRHTYSPRR